MPPPGVCMSIVNARHSKDGYGTIDNPDNFLKQDYRMLKEMCLSRQVRYIDDMFPPDRRSIGNNLLSPDDLQRVQWLRPAKLVPNPSFVTDGVSRFDFGQGLLGNCWFLASMGALTFQRGIFEQVVPLDQNFVQDYCGLFHFRFWRFGRWVDVTIDDKLPTLNGTLIFVHSKDPTEFWPALLEKAYAKVCGSYSDMNAGTPNEALVDFTGGVHICIQLSEPPSNLWEIMFRAGQFKSLMGCGTPQGKTSANTVLPNGLVEGHAYTITGVRQMMSRGQVVKMVRLLNPWGKVEWNGDWSDGSPLWKTVSQQDRDMCLAVFDNGEFWMCLEDFCRFYDDLDICCLCPEFLDGESSCHWKTSFYEGRWLAGKTAGGCMNFPDSFWTNPQYRVTIDKLEGACAAKQGDINMLVSLMQKPDKRNRALVKNLHIGFSVFEVPEELKPQKGKFPAAFFSRNRPVAQSKKYLNAREVMELIALKPGEYLIVPSTFNANETASFILTILSKSETHIHENSGGHDHDHEHGHTDVEESKENKDMKILFQQLFDKYDEVDAVLLQKLLNDKVLKEDLKNGDFSIDACRSMVALMSTPGTGKLNAEQLFDLWTKIVMYKDVFLRTDVSQNGGLSLRELKNSMYALGTRVSEDMLNMLLLRYGTPSGHVTLENFISLALRLGFMKKIFNRFSDGMTVTLRESEWMYISMCN
nr:calpain-1 catalytic subunit-like [Doryrhamphus excisus]XP_057946309.1 calpain-1 catalytic subunit-like [Doryrhamphus excisus]XP_057946310.1 calpain-1 catalytic subunit-like [Doryrhamphus excisus]XP_057946311.1 calpain-1 catalytic subunit-like [Doryrhamphus excisus]XP_057946479.1 calpain-1 catalytic subunit-like isoform X2 [Doryrhamphus excisus]XP_057946480.1 calpain-1 catalytic subunit-like isoform X2 [Doryrhamphus excisus]